MNDKHNTNEYLTFQCLEKDLEIARLEDRIEELEAVIRDLHSATDKAMSLIDDNEPYYDKDRDETVTKDLANKAVEPNAKYIPKCSKCYAKGRLDCTLCDDCYSKQIEQAPIDPNNTMTKLIVVLADGETWTEIDGSKVMEISEEAFEELSSSDYRPKWFGDEMFPNDPIKEAYVTDLLITPNAFVTNNKEDNA